MFRNFSLTLQVNHACNLRCEYCYTGAKVHRPMPWDVGWTAIERALRSVAPGGELELGFFGGEPLLEADRIKAWLTDARSRAVQHQITVRPHLTTNGTVTHPAAWSVMNDPELALAVSCDGEPDLHDRARKRVNGAGSAAEVLTTLKRLRAAGQPVTIVSVIHPASARRLRETLEYFYQLGLHRIDLSLDLWHRWAEDDIRALEDAMDTAAEWWGDHLQEVEVNWFSEQLARLSQVPIRGGCARCGFGQGEVAVVPSGRVYPCERLIDGDPVHHPLQLPGDVFSRRDFLSEPVAPGRDLAACHDCALEPFCPTTCRCSNYVRTGNVATPDGLLCRWEKQCARTVLRVVRPLLRQDRSGTAGIREAGLQHGTNP